MTYPSHLDNMDYTLQGPKLLSPSEKKEIKDVFVNAFTDKMKYYLGKDDLLKKTADDELDNFKKETEFRCLATCRLSQSKKLLGFIIASMKNYPHYIYLRQAAVLPSEKQQGIGKTLISNILDHFSNSKETVVITRKQNNEARNFYKRIKLKKDPSVFERIPDVSMHYSSNEYIAYTSEKGKHPPKKLHEFFNTRQCYLKNKSNGMNSTSVRNCLKNI